MISILNFSCHFIEKGIAHYKCDPFAVLGYAKEYPELCQLTEDDEQGGLRFEIDKHRIGIRLTAPYSTERRAVA